MAAKILDCNQANIDFILDYNDQYALFQSCACADLVLNGFDESYFRLVALYYVFRNADRWNIVDALFSSVLLIASRSREFLRQSEFISLFLKHYPDSGAANNAIITNAMHCGNVELAEFYLRQQLHVSGNIYYALILYWCGLLLMHHDLAEHLPWLAERATLDGDSADFNRRLAFIRDVVASAPLLPKLEASEALCISLPSDTGRWNRTSKIFAKSAIHLTRVEGVAGKLTPFAIRTEGARRHIDGGDYGCFASHLAAWERVAMGDQPRLIVEDDAFPLFAFSLPALVRAMPDDADVVFLNQRFHEFANIGEPKSVQEYLAFTSIDVITPESSSGSSITGGEGYILNPSGARKLLDLYRTCFMPLPVDWFIFLATRSTVFQSPHFAPWQLERMAQATLKRGALVGYFTSHPSIICDDMDYSPRRRNS